MKWGSASTLIEDYTSFFKLERKYSKAFCWLIVFSFLYIFPILIANFYYIDDVGRAITGGISWNRDGRPLLTALIVFLSNGKPIMEISPWMQILAVIVFDYASILFARKYVVSASSLQIFFLTAFGFVNWFLLENVSYKYESLGMLASISIPLILYALPDKVGGQKTNSIHFVFCDGLIVPLSGFNRCVPFSDYNRNALSLVPKDCLEASVQMVDYANDSHRCGIYII